MFLYSKWLCLVILIVGAVSLSGTSGDVFALDVKGKEISQSKGVAAKIKGNKKLQLTLKKVINYLLKKNFDVRKALLDYRASNSELLRYQGRYDTNLTGKSSYSSTTRSPEDPAVRFQGTEVIQNNYELGASRNFSTGTTLSLGVNSLYQNIKGAEMDMGMMGVIDSGGEGYQSGVSLSLKQELLKNSFGISDRLNERIIENSVEMQRRLTKHFLANLLVEALIGYWNVSIAEESLVTAEIGLRSTVNIRNLVRRKRYLGLSEREELLDWNSKVLQNKNTHVIAKKQLYDARLAVARILNLDSNSDFEIIKAFRTTPPKVKFDHAFKDALAKRADLNNQRLTLKNVEMECRMSRNGVLPSLSLNASVGNTDYSRDSYSQTFNDVNKQWQIGVEMTYPLGNSEAEVRVRDAVIKYQSAKIELKNMENSVRDEIDSGVKNCEVLFSVFRQTDKSMDFSKRYYQQVFRRFRRGKYDAVRLKLALDNYIEMRHSKLKSLVNYNIALLRRDMSRNVIFENYGIDIDAIIKKAVKE